MSIRILLLNEYELLLSYRILQPVGYLFCTDGDDDFEFSGEKLYTFIILIYNEKYYDWTNCYLLLD